MQKSVRHDGEPLQPRALDRVVHNPLVGAENELAQKALVGPRRPVERCEHRGERAWLPRRAREDSVVELAALARASLGCCVAPVAGLRVKDHGVVRHADLVIIGDYFASREFNFFNQYVKPGRPL